MDTQKHISSAFDQDLMILNDSLQQLGDLACQQLEGAIEGLAMQNQANLDKVIKGDAALDALEAVLVGAAGTGPVRLHFPGDGVLRGLGQGREDRGCRESQSRTADHQLLAEYAEQSHGKLLLLLCCLSHIFRMVISHSGIARA